jgi:dTDP-4-amino-4,6-dideoxygalactose transaminase
MKIPFNKFYVTGRETDYINQAVESGKISGDGNFTFKCQEFFEKKYGFKKAMLTTSCTDALEMCAILLKIKGGDEVIIPSYTFVSTANAFILRGARIIFADSEPATPNIDPTKIESLITERTRAIVPVHYAGIACRMDEIVEIGKKYNLHIVEDAAQSLDSYYKGRSLGSLGALSAFSFHESKNVISGEGGMIVLNNDEYIKRAEIVREKGTNRSAFFRGEVEKYGWVDIGSSYLPSEIISAFLYAQLESLEKIQQKRISLWKNYYELLKPLEEEGLIDLPYIPEYATNNGHLFYIICKSLKQRTNLIEYLKSNNIFAVFHYLPLHKSEFYKNKHDGRELPNADKYSDQLLRLPMYYELSTDNIAFITEMIKDFYKV